MVVSSDIAQLLKWFIFYFSYSNISTINIINNEMRKEKFKRKFVVEITRMLELYIQSANWGTIMLEIKKYYLIIYMDG